MSNNTLYHTVASYDNADAYGQLDFGYPPYQLFIDTKIALAYMSPIERQMYEFWTMGLTPKEIEIETGLPIDYITKVRREMRLILRNVINARQEVK